MPKGKILGYWIELIPISVPQPDSIFESLKMINYHREHEDKTKDNLASLYSYIGFNLDLNRTRKVYKVKGAMILFSSRRKAQAKAKTLENEYWRTKVHLTRCDESLNE
jgi:hypothetical protein